MINQYTILQRIYGEDDVARLTAVLSMNYSQAIHVIHDMFGGDDGFDGFYALIDDSTNIDRNGWVMMVDYVEEAECTRPFVHREENIDFAKHASIQETIIVFRIYQFVLYGMVRNISILLEPLDRFFWHFDHRKMIYFPFMVDFLEFFELNFLSIREIVSLTWRHLDFLFHAKKKLSESEKIEVDMNFPSHTTFGCHFCKFKVSKKSMKRLDRYPQFSISGQPKQNWDISRKNWFERNIIIWLRFSLRDISYSVHDWQIIRLFKYSD